MTDKDLTADLRYEVLVNLTKEIEETTTAIRNSSLMESGGEMWFVLVTGLAAYLREALAKVEQAIAGVEEEPENRPAFPAALSDLAALLRAVKDPKPTETPAAPASEETPTPQQKYKVGDTVRVVLRAWQNTDKDMWVIGTVKSVSADYGTLTVTHLDEDNEECEGSFEIETEVQEFTE